MHDQVSGVPKKAEQSRTTMVTPIMSHTPLLSIGAMSWRNKNGATNTI